MARGGKPKDLAGQQFGRLVVIRYAGRGENFCLCECGNEKLVRTQYLLDGRVKSCGCGMLQNNKLDLTGATCGFLTYIGEGPPNDKRRMIKVRCVCGTEYVTQAGDFIRQRLLSCGCYSKSKKGRK